jgi:hypothetical protein
MDLKEGDLVVTLPRIDQIRSIVGELTSGLIGVVVETDSKFDNQAVYGILINEKIYYLFHDEVEKLEDK